MAEPVPKVFVVIWIKGQGQNRSGPKKKVLNSKLSKTCQVWYQIKGFDRCNINKQFHLVRFLGLFALILLNSLICYQT